MNRCRSHLIMLVCNWLLSKINSLKKTSLQFWRKPWEYSFCTWMKICPSLWYYWVQRWLEYIKALETVRTLSNIFNCIKWNIRNLSDLKSKLYKNLSWLGLQRIFIVIDKIHYNWIKCCVNESSRSSSDGYMPIKEMKIKTTDVWRV